MVLAQAEQSLGHESIASNLRGCEFSSFGVGPSGGLVVSLKDGKLARQVMHCDHRLCPWCAPRRAFRMKEQLRPAIRETFTCRLPRLITLTQDDRAGESLKSAFERLLGAFKRLRRLKRWKAIVRGGVVALEVTRNVEAGSWHPHMHLLVDCDWYENRPEFGADLLEDWRTALGTTGLPIGGARIEEVGKNHDKMQDKQNAGVDEVVKYVGKGIEVAEWPEPALRELLAWMRGRRMLRTFGHLYGVKIDDEETPVVEEEGAGEEFMDTISGEVLTRDAVTFVASASVQAAGWEFMAERWKASHERPPERGSSP